MVGEFGAFAAETSWEKLSPDVRETALLLTADTVGAVLGGANAPYMSRLRSSTLKREIGGEATLLATGLPRTELTWAAFLNASAGTVLELDEWHPPTGHAPIHIIPPLFALAERQGNRGSEVLAGVVVGYEIATRIHTNIVWQHGFHPHGPVGAIASAAACGKLLGLAAERISTAMNIAASMMPVTAYEACYQGVFVRNSYAGEGARLGLTAALMAEAGFTAGENEVEEALSRVTSHIDASRIRPLEDGVYNILRYHIKLHAACGLSMGPLDAINAALGRREISPADVRRVDIVVTERTMPMGGTNPPTDLAARFSLPYEVAARLVTGASDHTAYDERYLRDPVIAQLQTRIQLHPDPDLKDGEAIARISLVDGSVLEGRCQKPRGRFDNPADRNEVLQKFESLARLSLPDEQAEALRLELEGLDRATSLAELWERVKSSTPSGASLRAAPSAV